MYENGRKRLKRDKNVKKTDENGQKRLSITEYHL